MKLFSYSHLTVYETWSRFYLVGSDPSEQRFAVLKVDRTEPKSLQLSDGGHEYSRGELNELLKMIHDGNQSTNTKPPSTTKNQPGPGLSERMTKVYGLLGFVRFLEGYYMILVSKASQVAQLGYYPIFKVEEVTTLYISCDGGAAAANADEQKYLRLFQSVDLTTNFYFSYTFDISRTLQENVLDQPSAYTYDEKYTWNHFLIEPLLTQGVSARWVLPVIHGYASQVIIALPGVKLGLMLIGRRSCRFAGTRFLKRGASLGGNVANEIETEQLVWEWSSVGNPERGRFASFVQHRGSVPLVWSQDPTARTPVMGKPPPIQHDLADPFAQIPALHFRDLKAKYGDPVVVINLVKRRERRAHESILADQYRSSISYLNQFLRPEEAILYLSFDMARCNKAGEVLPKLEEIAYNVLRLHGWFQSFPPLYFQQVRRSPLVEGVKQRWDKSKRRLLQSGVPRTNCVDCLDRTNVAQFVIGKVALAHQLHALGVLDEPVLPLQTEVCRQLELLYEEHGDTLALQYAGSYLVHSINTYKKTQVIQERSRDVIQTLSRYYSSTFADYDKQSALNLFLGIYRPGAAAPFPSLWELTTDLYLHNKAGRPLVDYCAWFLPDPPKAILTPPSPAVRSASDARDDLDPFDIHYRTFEMTSMEPLLTKLTTFIKVFNVDSVKAETAGQPFLRLWKRQTSEAIVYPPNTKQKTKQTDKKGQEDMAEESSSEEEASDTEVQYATHWTNPGGGSPGGVVENAVSALDTLDKSHRRSLEASYAYLVRKALPTMREVYGTDLHPPSRLDMTKYETYASLGGLKPGAEDLEFMRKQKLFSASQETTVDIGQLRPMSLFTNDSTFAVEMPVVSESALRKYKEAVECASNGPKKPRTKDALSYKNYTQLKWKQRTS